MLRIAASRGRLHFVEKTQVFPFSKVNEAMAELHDKKPVHLIVLTHN